MYQVANGISLDFNLKISTLYYKINQLGNTFYIFNSILVACRSSITMNKSGDFSLSTFFLIKNRYNSGYKILPVTDFTISPEILI